MRGKGFTLIELIIVIAIMAAFMALVLPRFFNFNKSQDLQNEAESLKLALRTIQNNALSGVNKCTNARSSSWFIKILQRSSDNVIYYQTGELCSDATTVLLEPYYLTSDVSIDKVELKDCSTDLKTSSPQISYNNISGAVTYNHSFAGCPITTSSTQMAVTLKSTADPDHPLKLTIDSGGSLVISSI